jgi:chromosome segregation ATPase
MTDPSNDGPDSIVLRYLRRIDEKADRITIQLSDLTGRVSAVEMGLTLLNGRVDRLEARIDRIEGRLERIERRLNLIEA